MLSLIGAMVARSLLFGLRPSDPKTVFMAIAMLAVVAMAASYFPARWGARLIRLPRYVMNEFRKIAGDPQRKVIMQINADQSVQFAIWLAARKLAKGVGFRSRN